MGKTTPVDLDWEKLDEFELPEDLSFVDEDAPADPGEQRKLEEFLREFQENSLTEEILEIRPVGEGEPDF